VPLVRKCGKLEREKMDKLKYLPYQKEAIRFVESHNGYAIIGDDCGIGKTMEAIGVSDLSYPGKYIIICTKSMKLKWMRELKKWTGKDSYIINGEKEKRLPKNYDYYIINYHILGRENAEIKKEESAKKKLATENNLTYKMKSVPVEGWWQKISELGIIGIIIDEAHRGLNNPKAIWTRSIVELYKTTKPKVFLSLSGTPIRKRPKNFYTMLHLTAPNLFPNEYKYYYRYCDPKHTRWGWTFDGSTNEEELHELVSKIMIRRMKEDVQSQLPNHLSIPIPLELSSLEAKEYINAQNDFIELLNKSVQNKIIIKNHISTLKQLAYISKRNSLFEWLDDYLLDHSKLVIFTWHKIVMNDLMSRYGKISVKIDGSVSNDKRQLAEDSFNTNKNINFFIGQIDAGGEGLTLTSSDSVCLVEYPDTPGQVKQAIDRIRRIGQKALHLYLYLPYAPGTVEEDIINELETSSSNVSMILDGKKNKTIFNHSFDDCIINRLKN